jgi:chaperone required for assembly of F1-ATPase
MDEDDTQHLGDPMALAALTAAVVLTGAVLMAAVLVMGCAVAIHVEAQPAQVKPADMVGPPAAFTTLDGDSKDATLSIPAKRSER